MPEGIAAWPGFPNRSGRDAFSPEAAARASGEHRDRITPQNKVRRNGWDSRTLDIHVREPTKTHHTGSRSRWDFF